MEVVMSGSRTKASERLSKWGLAILLIAAALAPGFIWPAYFRWASTIVFTGLALIVVRAYLAAFVSFKRSRAPPEKPEHLQWPTVSVLVVAYNEGSVLPRTLASMQQVDYPADRIEFVYVYEKRSTDATSRLIRDYAARDPRFIAVERDDKRGGKAAACNYGLPHCTGELLVNLDADHALDPGAVKRAVRWFMARPDVHCVKGRPIGMNGKESYLALITRLERDAIEKGDLYMRQVLRSFTFFGGGQSFFRRSVFEQLGGFDEDILVEDIEFSIKMHRAGMEILCDPSILTFEEHPSLPSAWWAQRKRWLRGWMQVAIRYLPQIHKMESLSWRKKLDLYHTLGYLLVPISFVLLPLLGLLGNFGYDTTVYYQGAWVGWAWMSFAAISFVGWLCTYVQDLRDGVRHELRELLAFPTLWAYLTVQTVVFWDAFLEEFVFRRPSVYVKTSKTGGDALVGVPGAAPVRPGVPAEPVAALAD